MENTRHIALMRGINVGGRNRLPMKALITLFEALGCLEVHTYIQSGNVVYRPSSTPAHQLGEQVTAMIMEHHGLQVPVVIRTAAELEGVLKANLFLTADCEIKPLHVMFLKDQPSPAQLERLDPERSSPDRFGVIGREVYLHLPNGAARSKLTTHYFDTRLETISTARNWKTVLKLIELARQG